MMIVRFISDWPVFGSMISGNSLSVDWVTGSSKLPPAGETVPPIVTEPVEP